MLTPLACAVILAAPTPVDVITVGPGPLADFPNVQAAIDAAADGDEIQIANGTYAGDITIASKSLTLTGEPGVNFSGGMTVSNLAPAQDVVLRNLTVGPPNTDRPGLNVDSCQGLVLVEDCSIFGTFAPGVSVENSDFLVVNGTTVVGGMGFGGAPLGFGFTGEPGLQSDATGLAMAIYESSFTGGIGATACDGGRGGPGLVLANMQVFLSHVTSRGGMGGSPNCCTGFGGNGGTGIVVQSSTSLLASDIDIGGGQGLVGCYSGLVTVGYDGQQGIRSVIEAGAIVEFVDESPTVTAPTTIASGETLALTSTRLGGDDVWVLLSDAPAAQFDFTPGTSEAAMVAFQGPAFTGPEWQFVGVTSAGTGSLTANLNIPRSAISDRGRTYLQSVHVENSTGDIFYGPLRIVDQPAQEIGTPFCFGDGDDALGCQDCPCGNESAPGQNVGCLNGTGRGCRLFARGSVSVTQDRLLFDVEGVNPNTIALLFSATGQLPANGLCAPGTGIPAANLDGLRCIGGNKRRHGLRATNSEFENNASWGAPFPSAGIAAAAGFAAGETRNFQVSYREDPLLSCGQAIQLSNGVEIIFTP